MRQGQRVEGRWHALGTGQIAREAPLQHYCTERACQGQAHFLNKDFFTKHVGDHWGGSVEDKKKVKENLNSEPDTTHGTISHDCLATAMFSSARTCDFLPRICMQHISGAQWGTFYNFASYKEAHTAALQDIKRGNSSSWGTAGATPHMTTQRAKSGGQRVCIGHEASCQNATNGNR